MIQIEKRPAFGPQLNFFDKSADAEVPSKLMNLVKAGMIKCSRKLEEDTKPAKFFDYRLKIFMHSN